MTRTELIAKGTKLAALMADGVLIEAFRHNSKFYHAKNLEDTTQVGEGPALNTYIHPSAKDRVSNPAEYFSLDTLADNWTSKRSSITYQSKSGPTFEYIHDFQGAPTIKTLSPGTAEAEPICTLEDAGIKDRVARFNDEYFIDPGTGYQRSNESWAILYFIDPKTIERSTQDPLLLFPSLKKVAADTKIGKPSADRYSTKDGYLFSYKKSGEKPEVEIINWGLKQRETSRRMKLS